mgnify:CR=1 FL=1|tara:strand:- start:501 stop:716 length:216 start_codon:yes stop_codon:yes gene_type:complete
MTIDEAAKTLKRMYDDPATGKAVSVHLFGIRHAEELGGMNLKEVATRAGISENYATEIRKGITLAPFVVER